MSLLTLPGRPVSLGSECALSYNVDEMPEVGLEYARSGQLINTVRSSVGVLADLLGTELLVAPYTPRISAFDDGTGTAVNGEGAPVRLGRLMEMGRTNGLTYSADLSQAAWVKVNATVATDTTKGPDAKTLAYKIKEDNTAGVRHGITRATPALTNSVRSAFSFSAKAAERTWLYIRSIDKSNTGRSTWINLSTGAVGTKDSGHVVWVKYRRGGWWRIGVSFDAATGATAPSIEVYTATADNTSTFNGVTGSGVYCTDLQFETDKVYPSSPIATGAATASRSADEFKVTVSVPLPDAFSVLVEIARPAHFDLAGGVDIGNAPFFWGWGAVGGNRFGIYHETTIRSLYAFIDATGAGGGLVSSSRAIPAGRMIRIAAQWRNISTGGQVRIDVNDGAGFTAYSGAAVPFSTLSSYTMGCGELGSGGTNVGGTELVSCRAFFGLRTLTEMLRTR